MNTDTNLDGRNPSCDSNLILLAGLQRTVRRLAWMLALTLLIAVLALIKAMETRVRKQEYVLLDTAGMPRAVLGTRDNSPFLSMFDSDGYARIAVSLDQDEPLIRLSNASSTTHAGLWVRADGARLALVNENGSGLRLHAHQHDARVHFQDGYGWPRLALGIDDNAPFIGLMATNLLPRVFLGADETGGRISFFDDRNSRLLTLGVHNNRPFLNPVTSDDQPDGHETP